jgi:hypothetical protein
MVIIVRGNQKDFDFQGFKSLPLHFFQLFPGETCRETEKRFERLNAGTLEGRFYIARDTLFSLTEEH